MKKYICSILLLLSVTVYGSNVFHNPVLWADVPDPDVIRVGSDYYMVSTTMHLMPGAPIMHSKDLVNWETVSYLFNKLTDSPKYDMKGGTVYGRGQWATSLKYYKGKFYALFAPNDSQGGNTYIYTTDKPEKGWTLHSRLPHFHDSSFLFDDDGKVYVFSGTGRLQELNSTLTGLKTGGVDMTVFKRDSTETGLLEGSRAIKHNGKYYLLMISWPYGKPRRQVCYRSDNITGPYEKKVILEDNFAGFPYAGQGTIVDDTKGNWYGVIFQDRGAVGRVLTLMPCRWIDGWPMLGDENGKIPAAMNIPVQGYKKMPLVVSDDFSSSKLKINWQWNHNPVDNSWSLTERRGFLRLKTSRVVDNIFAAPNTISQRMEGPQCSATVAIDITHMVNGDKAGFAAFNGNSGLLTISKNGSKTSLVMETAVVNLSDRDKKIESVDVSKEDSVELKVNKIYLRIDGDFRLGRDIATFYYSTDNKNWKSIGKEYKMQFDYRRLFMGTRYAIFNYATVSSGGYIDVDNFSYNKK